MAEINKDVFVVLLRDLARQISNLDEGDFQDILDGAAKLQITVQPSRRPPAKRQKLSNTEYEAIVRELGKMNSREDGLRLLDEKAVSKEELTRLARIVDIPVRKGEQVDILRSRLIEATIGHRLNSAAIQGNTNSESDRPSRGSEATDSNKGKT